MISAGHAMEIAAAVVNYVSYFHLVLIAGLAIRIFSRRSLHGSAVAWLLLIILLPVVGVALYLLVGERRLGKTWIQRSQALHPQMLRWAERIPPACIAAPEGLTLGGETVSRLALAATRLPLTRGNHLQLLADSSSSIRALIADIDNANESVRLEFYIWSAGGFVDDLVAALIRAAQRGVHCTALMDSLGSRVFLKGQDVHSLRKAGVVVVEVLPVNPLRALLVRFDLRDHRKIAVIDRNIAYTGSMNIADPHYFKRDAGVGEWVDAMVRVEGPAAWILEGVSFSLHSMQTGELFAPPEPPEQAPTGNSTLQVYPSGPHTATQRIDVLLLAAIYAARREIVITTPYFVPGEALLTALRSAALRGVRVVLIMPERIDSHLVRFAGQAYLEDMLAVGITILQFRDGLLHTKSMVIDEEITLFGTVNFDLRSFELNFELSLIIYDAAFANQMRALQKRYEARSSPLQLEQWRARPGWRRIVENAVQTMGPLL